MYAVFEQLVDERGLSNYKVSKDTGISQTTLSRWKLTGKDPKRDKLIILANYLNVTVDYLITGETNDGVYLDKEALSEAQEMYDDTDMRMLFKIKQKDPARFNAFRRGIEAAMEAEMGEFDEGC